MESTNLCGHFLKDFQAHRYSENCHRGTELTSIKLLAYRLSSSFFLYYDEFIHGGEETLSLGGWVNPVCPHLYISLTVVFLFFFFFFFLTVHKV